MSKTLMHPRTSLQNIFYNFYQCFHGLFTWRTSARVLASQSAFNGLVSRPFFFRLSSSNSTSPQPISPMSGSTVSNELGAYLRARAGTCKQFFERRGFRGPTWYRSTAICQIAPQPISSLKVSSTCRFHPQPLYYLTRSLASCFPIT